MIRNCNMGKRMVIRTALVAATLLSFHACLARASSCGLQGFQLDTLQEPGYWRVTLQSHLCLVPVGYEDNNITSCVFYFSVCKALPGEQCGGVTNSSTCQEVATNDGQIHYYSIGDYRGNGVYEATGDSESVGFLTIRERDNLNTRLCKGTFETTLIWECDMSTVWDTTSHDVTKFMQSATKDLSNCFLELSFLYNGACYEAPTLTPDYCQLQHYDVVGLTREDYWMATVPNEACYGDELVSCRMLIAFCQPVPLSIDSGCYGAAVCQVGMDAEGSAVTYNLGQFKDSTRFYANDQAVHEGFHMVVSNGSKPDDGRCNKYGITTRVVLFCNMSASWKQRDVSNLIRVAYAGALDPCEYIIFLPYYGACLPVWPTASTSHHPDSHRTIIICDHLSVGVGFFGVLFLILLVIVVIVYWLLYKQNQLLSYQKLHNVDDQENSKYLLAS